MANDPKLHEAAVARSVDLARDAGRHEGTPDAAWSLGEKLLTALVFQGPEQLEALGWVAENCTSLKWGPVSENSTDCASPT